MEWMVVNPLEIHSTFASLGVSTGDNYQASENCLSNLSDILQKLSTEDKTLRTFRRALGFTEVIKTDLLPLLINVKDDQIIAATVRILVNLTIPLECLLPIDVMSKNDIGRHTIFELNKLLISGKEAFVEPRSTKAVVEYLKQVLQKNNNKLSIDECENVNNCLLLLRNVLHIPESRTGNVNAKHNVSMQNQILWNLFTQNIDKVLITLMTCTHKSYWSVTMVQLIALIYKDQHVGVMQKLLNQWFEASLSESSEDNESNTSPMDGSGDSSPMLTSDRTSDSSSDSSRKQKRTAIFATADAENTITKLQISVRHITHQKPRKANGKMSNEQQNKGSSSGNSSHGSSIGLGRQSDGESGISSHKLTYGATQKKHSDVHSSGQKKVCSPSSDISDCGYATQAENQDNANSTLSNDDDGPSAKRVVKPVHQKPHTQKIRYTPKQPTGTTHDKDWRRKKLGKRSRSPNLNMMALMHHSPSDEDISNLLRDFTVDFLLKGYGSLVQELHNQLLTNNEQVQIDKSHFFWLVTYFLKFSAQLELDLEHVSQVLTFDIISYLTYEGVNLFEQLELASQKQTSEVLPCLRGMHLVVTAIREFLHAVETYNKITHLCLEDKNQLIQLQINMGSTNDLKSLFVLLLQNYNSKFQSKQYLQDLIVTNHLLLQFYENVTHLPGFTAEINMTEHIKQFATIEVMCHYGLLLEGFQDNGKFTNDCIFTMMHHVSGSSEQATVLFQPTILKTFSQIWEMDFEICDDWSDLIEYVMQRFINTPRQNAILPQVATLLANEKEVSNMSSQPTLESSSNPGWSTEDSANLYWYYVQSSHDLDAIKKVKELYYENGTVNMTRIGIIQQLQMQDVIDGNKFDDLMKIENLTVKSSRSSRMDNEDAENNKATTISSILISKLRVDARSILSSKNSTDEIKTLCEYLQEKKKDKQIIWLQKSLIEACYVKLNMKNGKVELLNGMPKMEPIPYHYLVLEQSIPIVSWNSEQRNILSYQPFITLLHKIGLHVSEDTKKAFPRIPHFWSADMLFSVAAKLGPINSASLKFDRKLIGDCDKTCVTKEVTSSMELSLLPVTNIQPANQNVGFLPVLNTTPNWLQLVANCKTKAAPQLMQVKR